MKNEQLQAMGVTPYLGDTRPKFKGGRKAEKSLTSAVKSAEAARDEAKELLEFCRGTLSQCIRERIEAGKLCAAAKKSMFREIVWGVCWSVVMLLFVIGTWIFN